ncbi:1209_t:CDS:2 [Funneliformis caledonium]|uniref:1209_t:CDS:1 n=1 Tax=Funneliformis caledonium TaxID=1117310 RepID=A0A9N9HJH9_9GLOM|nr:1209_t:CDS:2 [Funneliformis caledonium]
MTNQNNILTEEEIKELIVKSNEEVKSLQSLTTNLEQERNDLLEINKQLEEEQKVLEEALELEEDISKCHLDTLEVARQWRVR